MKESLSLHLGNFTTSTQITSNPPPPPLPSVLHEPLWRINAIIESGVTTEKMDWTKKAGKKQKLTHNDYVEITGNSGGKKDPDGSGNLFDFIDTFLDIDLQKRLAECVQYKDTILDIRSAKEDLANEVTVSGEIERTKYFKGIHKKAIEWKAAIEKRIEEANDAIELEGGEREEFQSTVGRSWEDILKSGPK